MSDPGLPATADTNIAVYALAAEEKAELATKTLRNCAFLSVQVLNEYANVGARKRRDAWDVIAGDLDTIRALVPVIMPVEERTNVDAVRIASRYRLSFFDALMIAAALSGGARILYSEDMQHGLLIDDILRIVDPYRADTAAL